MQSQINNFRENTRKLRLLTKARLKELSGSYAGTESLLKDRTALSLDPTDPTLRKEANTRRKQAGTSLRTV